MKLKSCMIIVTNSLSYILFCSYILLIWLLCCGHTFQLSSDSRYKYLFFHIMLLNSLSCHLSGKYTLLLHSCTCQMTQNIYYLHVEINRLYNVLIFVIHQCILLYITVICDYIHKYKKVLSYTVCVHINIHRTLTT